MQGARCTKGVGLWCSAYLHLSGELVSAFRLELRHKGGFEFVVGFGEKTLCEVALEVLFKHVFVTEVLEQH